MSVEELTTLHSTRGHLPSLHALVATHLERQPGDVAIARANIVRWLKDGVQHVQAPDRLRAWDAVLLAAQQTDEGMQALLALLRSENEAQARMLEFSPFAGVLPREARRQARELCGYRH